MLCVKKGFVQDGNVRKKEEEETQREQEQREAETRLKKMDDSSRG